MKFPGASSMLVMRGRGVWEAADSGILLWRENFFYLIPLFAAPVWIVSFSLFLIPEQFRLISPLALWWLKPLFDRLCLHVTACRFFSGAPDGDSSANGFSVILRGLAGNFFYSLPGDLLWRRFSPLRSAVMPLRILERPAGKLYAERKNILASGGLNFCALLSCFGLIAEAALLGGEIIFFAVIAQNLFPSFSLYGVYNAAWIVPAVYGAYTFNYILVESLYVSMGFGLYINSRTEIEGWDIELLFRKFAEGERGKARQAARNNGKTFKVIYPLFIFFGLFFFAPSLDAEEDIQTPLNNPAVTSAQAESGNNYFPGNFMGGETVPLESLGEILSSGDFGGTRSGWEVRLKKRDAEEKPESVPEINFSPDLKKLKEILSHGLRILVILVTSGFIVFALIKFYRSPRPGKFNRLNGIARANNPAAGENPEYYFKKAETFFARGFLKEAWGACFRGTVISLVWYRGLYFPPDATEYGCLDLVRSFFSRKNENSGGAAAGANIIEGFDRLVQSWVLFAYGGRNPDRVSFEKALEYGRNLKSIDYSTAAPLA